MIEVGAWSGLELVEPVAAGNRNRVWRGRLRGEWVAVRHSRRSPESLTWELDLIEHLARHDFVVPLPLRCDDGSRSANGVVVQTWLDGKPPSSPADWQRVADELGRLHTATAGYAQRPGCVTTSELGERRRSVDANIDALPPEIARQILTVFGRFTDVPTAVIHGDPGADNLRVASGGRIGMIDWDEARVDLTWHDLSSLGIQVLPDDAHRRSQLLSDAWEAVNAWTIEPAYAARRLRRLGPPADDR